MSTLRRSIVLLASAAIFAVCGGSKLHSWPAVPRADGGNRDRSSHRVRREAHAGRDAHADAHPDAHAGGAVPFRAIWPRRRIPGLETGTATTTAWDGTGAPGDGDTFVDTLIGPAPHTLAFGEPTTATLDEFVAASRAASAAVHSCPATPETTTKMTVGGAPARLDALRCGVFVLTAIVVRAGRAYEFVLYDQPGNEAADR